jgi:hypothetical protein
MVGKARQLLCDPLKCFAVFFSVNIFLFGLCSTGYFALDKKIDRIQTVIDTKVTGIYDILLTMNSDKKS